LVEICWLSFQIREKERYVHFCCFISHLFYIDFFSFFFVPIFVGAKDADNKLDVSKRGKFKDFIIMHSLLELPDEENKRAVDMFTGKKK